jgi:thiol-disulfide isomerase/thioredoxin
MVKKSSFAFLSFVLLLSLAALPAFGYVAAGNKLGDLEFGAPLTAEDAAYLGVPADKPFKLSQLGAPFLLVEVFATGCSHCYMHAPQMNKFFELVNKDPQASKKLKILGLAAGDTKDNCVAWKKQCKVPFAMVADPDRKVTDKLNIMGTPTTILLNKNGDVLHAKAGAFESPEAFLKELIGLMK